jgi:hypothetical protein
MLPWLAGFDGDDGIGGAHRGRVWGRRRRCREGTEAQRFCSANSDADEFQSEGKVEDELHVEDVTIAVRLDNEAFRRAPGKEKKGRIRKNITRGRDWFREGEWRETEASSSSLNSGMHARGCDGVRRRTG